MPVHWRSEACDMHPDPVTGIRTVRLTQAALHSINIYCEQPYTSPDGKRIAIMRSTEPDPRIPPWELLVADVDTLRITSVEKGATSQFCGTAAWTGWIYYTNASNELARVNIQTLEKEILWTRWPFPPDFVLQSVSADLKHLIGVQFRADFHSEIIRVDLAERTWKSIYEHPECLGHLQFNPVDGNHPWKNHILVQHNRGVGYNHQWEGKRRESKLGGATHFIVDVDGKNQKPLAIGEPHTISSAGHSAWVADTGRIALATHFDGDAWALDKRWPAGNFFTVGPGDAKPRVYEAPEHRFNHVNVSRCGTYAVCDSYPTRLPGNVALVVINLKTGKHRTLLPACGSTGGGSAASHPHAYFTADNKNVIYNADPFWIGHVWAARVPPEFLKSLD